MGAAKATATPAADDALNTSRRFPSLKLYLSNILEAMFPTQHAIWTNGPDVVKFFYEEMTFFAEGHAACDA
jgi:hypothetical protein